MIESKAYIVGVDEVGKGSLFGPVFAGAVILDLKSEKFLLGKGVKDSKKLNKKERERLAPLIKEKALAWALGQASANEIDQIGIRQATEVAMVRALQKISKPIGLVLIDGVLPLINWQGQQKNLVRGESKSAAIASASILAKVSRDALIKRLAKEFKGFGLEKNAGYGTQLHRESLKISGPSRLHRKTFLSKILAP